MICIEQGRLWIGPRASAFVLVLGGNPHDESRVRIHSRSDRRLDRNEGEANGRHSALAGSHQQRPIRALFVFEREVDGRGSLDV